MELIKRTMPRNFEAERAVIGSMLMDINAVNTVTNILNSSEFYYKEHRIMFEAMVWLADHEKPIDFVTLHAKLALYDAPEKMREPEYIKQFLDAVPSSAHVRYYAEIVHEKAVLRRLIHIAEDIERDCYQEINSNAILHNTETIISGVIKEESK